MKTLLEVKGVSVINKDKYRIKNITFSIKEGERIALLGKSGAGKSSLLSVSNGSLPPSEGSVKWKGESLKSISRKQSTKIATLWQDLRIIEELNVAQNVNSGALGRNNFFWGLRNLIGIIEKSECINCLSAAGLPHELIASQISNLSGGQKQRVAIARLLRQEAELVFADEPLSSLDPLIAKDILMLFLARSENNIISIPQTYLISIHQPELIKHFTRVIGLKNGEIVINKYTNELNSYEIDSLYR